MKRLFKGGRVVDPANGLDGMFDAPLAIVDLETTGTHSGFDRITEVGIVTLTDDGIARVIAGRLSD